MPAAAVIIRYLRARRQVAAAGSKGWFLLAWAFSLLFHPLLIPTISAAVIFRCAPELLPFTDEGKWGILFFVFLSTFFLPACGIGLFWASGIIQSLSMDERKDRHLPHLLAFLIFLGVAFLFNFFLPMFSLPFCLMLGSAVSVCITGIITLFWKISSHMVGLGGLVGFQITLARLAIPENFLMSILLSILICGAVFSSRLYLRAHDNRQLFAGFFLGIVISSLTISFFAVDF